MRIERASFGILGLFFIAAGVLLGVYGQGHAPVAVVAVGLFYVAAGTAAIAWSLKPRRS
ncbi:MAG TPA: hypothetical protein VEY12_02765 [Thermoplasmata archaeon]|nr:hypothetical protein [Thermoplasmata archaeon]